MMKRSVQTIKLAIIGLAIPAIAVALLTVSPAAGAPVNGAEATYKAKCAACHGADGSGKTPMGQKLGLRDLRSPEVQNQSNGQLLEVIAKGKNKMPGYEKSLGAEACKQLVTYMRELAKKS
jgi:mono/diheme cytochrome c family protein